MDELRKKGLEKMNEVYGWEMPDMPGEYFALTVDHLFGTIWTRAGSVDAGPALDAARRADRAGHRKRCWRSRLNAILSQRRAHRDELKEIAIFLTHYVGFPLGSKLDGAIHRVVPKAQEGRGGRCREGREGQRQRRRSDVRGKDLHDK